MPSKNTVDSLREGIDRIDAQVLKLLNRRACLALRIGHSKMRSRHEELQHLGIDPIDAF